MYVYIYIHIYVYIQTYTYTYIHTGALLERIKGYCSLLLPALRQGAPLAHISAREGRWLLGMGELVAVDARVGVSVCACVSCMYLCVSCVCINLCIICTCAYVYLLDICVRHCLYEYMHIYVYIFIYMYIC